MAGIGKSLTLQSYKASTVTHSRSCREMPG
jgi:hypothetical protein